MKRTKTLTNAMKNISKCEGKRRERISRTD
jgi:hypothetical protein